MDAIASTIGNMVVDRVATTSTSTLYGPNGNVDANVASATVYQSTSPNVFSMPAENYSTNTALFGPGGPLDSLNGVTGSAARSAYASSQVVEPYSGASVLYGPNLGFSNAGPLGTDGGFRYTGGSSGTAGSIGLAGDDPDALKYAWDMAKQGIAKGVSGAVAMKQASSCLERYTASKLPRGGTSCNETLRNHDGAGSALQMNMDLFKEWQLNPAASDDVFDQSLAELGFSLPPDYVEFLRRANGGEGFVGDSYFILWKIEELKTFNLEYEVNEYAPGLLLFGSDGGGEGYGFDTRGDKLPIVRVPFVGMELRYATVVATGFANLFSGVAK